MADDEITRSILSQVGYGHPPKETRFQKGQSGNPKGRPKKTVTALPLKSQPTLSAVLRTAERTVSVREDGELKEMTRRQAMAEATFASALKGNARAQALVFQMLREADAVRAREIAERNAFWKNYREQQLQLAAKAEAKGLPAPTLLPHPDDIIISDDEGPRIIGPLDPDEQAKLEETIRIRNVLIMQEALDRRSSVRLSGKPLTDPGSAAVMAHLLERSLPNRYRLPRAEWVKRMMKFEDMPIRVLLKELREAWRQLGRSVPRGYVFPNLSEMTSTLETLFEMIGYEMSKR